MEKQYRYPGANPFSENSSSLFFGRDQDIRALTRQVALENLVVLFGKSGYGKTSLLHAGVIPKLRNEKRHHVIYLRLNRTETHPLLVLAEQLEAELGKPSSIAEKLEINKELPDDLNAKLWCLLKSLQLASPKHPYITLVFDPFEELFSYNQPHVESFGRALATMLDTSAPKAVRRLIKERYDREELSDAEVNPWFTPLNIKVVLSVRHDHMASLDTLKQYVPAIFKHTYELKPLSELQSLEALKKPAALEDSFESQPFTYSQAALNKIVQSLKDKRTQRIETFQLQLVAQRAEEKIIEKAKKAKAKNEKSVTSLPRLNLELTARDIGDPGLVSENYYQKIISGLPFRKRKGVERLIEKGLIVKDTRVPLPELVITDQYHVSEKRLTELVEKRLLRSERNSVDGSSYELSHDTLIEPIQNSARKRRRKQNYLIISILGIAALIGLLVMGYFLATAELMAERKAHEADSLRKVIKETKPIIKTVTVYVHDTTKVDSLKKVINSIQGIVDNTSNNIVDPTPPSPVPTVPKPPDTTQPREYHANWLKKLNALKIKLAKQPAPAYLKVQQFENPTDTRAPGKWEFPANRTHLVAIHISHETTRIFDAKNPEALFVLLIDGKAYQFLGATGFFKSDGKVAFMAEGQHLLRMGRPRSDRTLIPFQDGVVLFQDQDGNGTYSLQDIEKGLLPLANRDLHIGWRDKRDAINEPGRQYISDLYYLSPDDRTITFTPAEQNRNNREGHQNAYEVFVSLLWEQSEAQPIYYSLVDLADFDQVDQDEISRYINRLKTGQDSDRTTGTRSN